MGKNIGEKSDEQSAKEDRFLKRGSFSSKTLVN